MPQCIGIILDGNRRWARERGKPLFEGHRVGLRETLKKIVLAVRDRGIPHLAVFMFSTENWGRAGDEVSYLMDLFRSAAKEDLRELGREGVRIRFVGQKERFSSDLQRLMEDTEKETAHNTKITLWACLSYGGRAEIAAAAKSAVASAYGGDVSEDSLAQHLWTADMPDCDIIVRTSGEKRLSGFLMWKGAYAELFFLDAYWPDFDEKMLEDVLTEYVARERRMGK